MKTSISKAIKQNNRGRYQNADECSGFWAYSVVGKKIEGNTLTTYIWENYTNYVFDGKTLTQTSGGHKFSVITFDMSKLYSDGCYVITSYSNPEGEEGIKAVVPKEFVNKALKDNEEADLAKRVESVATKYFGVSSVVKPDDETTTVEETTAPVATESAAVTDPVTDPVTEAATDATTTEPAYFD